MIRLGNSYESFIDQPRTTTKHFAAVDAKPICERGEPQPFPWNLRSPNAVKKSGVSNMIRFREDGDRIIVRFSEASE